MSNPNALESMRHADDPWCLDCHAPRDEQRAEALQVLAGKPPEDLAAEGVGCPACHLDDGVVLSAHRPSRRGLSAHPMRQSDELSDERSCAGCHQFNFPRHDTETLVYGEEALQDTVEEWRRSPAGEAGRSCQTCHMGRAGHGFPGSHDPEMLARGLKVKVDSTALRLWSRAGHDVPTGDPFRLVVLDLCADSDCEQVLSEERFGRWYRMDETSWTLVRDRRIPADGEVVIPLSPEVAAWRLTYHYADPFIAPKLPDEERTRLVDQGTVD